MSSSYRLTYIPTAARRLYPRFGSLDRVSVYVCVCVCVCVCVWRRMHTHREKGGERDMQTNRERGWQIEGGRKKERDTDTNKVITRALTDTLTHTHTIK